MLISGIYNSSHIRSSGDCQHLIPSVEDRPLQTHILTALCSKHALTPMASWCYRRLRPARGKLWLLLFPDVTRCACSPVTSSSDQIWQIYRGYPLLQAAPVVRAPPQLAIGVDASCRLSAWQRFCLITQHSFADAGAHRKVVTSAWPPVCLFTSRRADKQLLEKNKAIAAAQIREQYKLEYGTR